MHAQTQTSVRHYDSAAILSITVEGELPTARRTDLPTLHEYRPALPRPRIDEPRASFAADVAREGALQPSPLRRAFKSTSGINVAITSSEA